ncbi:cupin domain-containing protein [Marivita hallyeonensis]|uniref:Cupin domain-containing protein n=1 Tax=Marivita hallyeonensis TaxID=996342 RepID=A0A1M5X6N6_9RHOB|nr:cupin domain-containing protein [Marivita hallyeonensis]SHH95312.1 Cupin domain-containing protein [Marivita hallyeonensis]
MQYHHLFADTDGESHWDDVDIALQERVFAPPAKDIEISDGTPVTSQLFLRLRSGWDEPIHPTPVKQMLICLRGRVAVTASNGARREIGPGDLWLMEDKHGKGHHTRVISDDDFECVIVQYE